MTDHLPECSESMIPDFHNERWICICDQLRACEQRVRDELFPLRWNRAEQLEEARVNGWHAGWNAALEDGYAAGLDAAREAVAAAIGEVKQVLFRDYPSLSARDGAQEAENCALAAIDALREKP